MSNKKVYKVLVSFEIISNLPAKDLEDKIEHLLDNGSIGDAFSSANLDASYFVVDSVKE